MHKQRKNKIEKGEQKVSLEGMDAYTRFFLERNSEKFVLYRDYPSLEKILNYYFEKSFLAEHPIQEYGKFDIRELAEIIKFLFSFHYHREYQVLTFGYLEKNSFSVLEGVVEQLVPKLCFLIGNDRSLKDYYPYQNLFLGREQIFDFSRKQESLVCLRPSLGMIQDTLGISCKGIDSLAEGGICYYDFMDNEYKVSKYLSMVSLFGDCFYSKLENYSGIWDTLSFEINDRDAFLAEALISMVIFKKNHKKLSLTNEDYQYLFYEMFQDNRVNIKKAMGKEIPKTLKYVPYR